MWVKRCDRALLQIRRSFANLKHVTQQFVVQDILDFSRSVRTLEWRGGEPVWLE